MLNGRAMGRSRTGLAALVALTLALATGCSNGPGGTPEITTTARAGVAPVPPKEGAYFGAWAPRPKHPQESPSASPETSGSPETSDSPETPPPGAPAARPLSGPVGDFERELGRPLDIVHAYRGWKSDFPTRADTEVLSAGARYLLLTWEGADTREIVAGRHDTLIRKRARAIRASGKPLFLRWQRDMDAADQEGRVHGAKSYIAAWKHLRTIFTQEGVANVAWVWCPTAAGFGGRNAQSFYPGDDQVDWICADAQPGGGFDYRDLSETLKLFLDWAGDRPKPIMVAEFGVPMSYGVRRAEWLRRAAETLQNPQVKAVVYFNSDEQADEPRDERRRYSVTGDKQAASALRELATTPYFNPRNLPVTSG